MESGLIFSELDLYLKYSMDQAKRLINFKIHPTLIGSWILMESWVLSGSWVSFFQYALEHGLLWKDNLMLG